MKKFIISFLILLLLVHSVFAFEINVPSTVVVNQPFNITVTSSGNPVSNATVFFSIGGAQFRRTTDTKGMVTFTPSTTGNLSITAIFGNESKTLTIQVGSDTVIGDLNGDNKVTSLDALMALQMSVGLIPVDLRADVNRDNKVTSVDALMILQASVGLVELGV